MCNTPHFELCLEEYDDMDIIVSLMDNLNPQRSTFNGY